MSRKISTSPIDGQEMLGNMEMVQMPRLEMAARRSIAGLLTPERMRIDPAHYTDIGDPERAAASPEAFGVDLMGVLPNTPGTVSYTQENGGQAWVALAPDEYTLAARSVRRLGEASRNRTIAARESSGPTTSRALAAGERSRSYTLDSKLQAHNVYINELTRQETVLRKLANASDGPNRGLSLLGGEINSRQIVEQFRTTILGSALGALASRRNWDRSQAELAYRTITKRTVLDRTNNEHLDYFESMVGLMLSYNGAKQAVFKSRKFELIAELRKNPIE